MHSKYTPIWVLNPRQNIISRLRDWFQLDNCQTITIEYSKLLHLDPSLWRWIWNVLIKTEIYCHSTVHNNNSKYIKYNNSFVNNNRIYAFLVLNLNHYTFCDNDIDPDKEHNKGWESWNTWQSIFYIISKSNCHLNQFKQLLIKKK